MNWSDLKQATSRNPGGGYEDVERDRLDAQRDFERRMGCPERYLTGARGDEPDREDTQSCSR